VFDYWLLGQYPNEQDLLAVGEGQATAPLGKPRLASEVPWPVDGHGGPQGAPAGTVASGIPQPAAQPLALRSPPAGMR